MSLSDLNQLLTIQPVTVVEKLASAWSPITVPLTPKSVQDTESFTANGTGQYLGLLVAQQYDPTNTQSTATPVWPDMTITVASETFTIPGVWAGQVAASTTVITVATMTQATSLSSYFVAPQAFQTIASSGSLVIGTDDPAGSSGWYAATLAPILTWTLESQTASVGITWVVIGPDLSVLYTGPNVGLIDASGALSNVAAAQLPSTQVPIATPQGWFQQDASNVLWQLAVANGSVSASTNILTATQAFTQYAFVTTLAGDYLIAVSGTSVYAAEFPLTAFQLLTALPVTTGENTFVGMGSTLLCFNQNGTTLTVYSLPAGETGDWADSWQTTTVITTPNLTIAPTVTQPVFANGVWAMHVITYISGTYNDIYLELQEWHATYIPLSQSYTNPACHITVTGPGLIFGYAAASGVYAQLLGTQLESIGGFVSATGRQCFTLDSRGFAIDVSESFQTSSGVVGANSVVSYADYLNAGQPPSGVNL